MTPAGWLTNAVLTPAGRAAWLTIAVRHMADRMAATGLRQGIHFADEQRWHKEERALQRQRRALGRLLAALNAERDGS